MYAPVRERLAQCSAHVGVCATERDAHRRTVGSARCSPPPVAVARGLFKVLPAGSWMKSRATARTQSMSTSGNTSTADAGAIPSASRIFRLVSMRHGHPDSTLSIVNGLTPARLASSALLIMAR